MCGIVGYIGKANATGVVLHTGLRLPQRLAGIMALSTYLPLADTLKAEAHPANADVPIFMAHGTDDPIIALALAFVKIDDMPLPRMIGLAIYYALNSKRYYFHPDATASKDELDQYLAIRKQGADNQQQ